MAVALIVAIRSVFDALRDHEILAGRPLSPEERDAILAAASAVTSFDERLSAIETLLQSIVDKQDLLIVRSGRPRPMDRGR